MSGTDRTDAAELAAALSSLIRDDSDQATALRPVMARVADYLDRVPAEGVRTDETRPTGEDPLGTLRGLVLSDDLGVATLARAAERALARATPPEASGVVASRRAHLLRVSAVQPTGRDAAMLTFDVPPELRSTYRWRAGEHVTVIVDVAGVELERHYSVCLPPSALEEGWLAIAVRATAAGLASPALCATAPGDLLELGPPEGEMCWPDRGDAPDRVPGIDAGEVLLVAVGSGITPVLAIAAAALEAGRRVGLLVVERRVDDVVLGERVAELAARFSATFTWQGLWTRAGDGRPDRARLRAELAVLADTLGEDPAVYVCGPDEVADLAVEALADLGLDHRVRRESFTSDRLAHVEVPRPGGELVVRLPSGTHTVQLLPGETLLVAMRRGGIDHPFSCLSGSCGTCLVDVAPGSVPAAVVQQPAGDERLYDRAYACLAANAIGHDDVAPEPTPSSDQSPESVRTQP